MRCILVVGENGNTVAHCGRRDYSSTYVHKLHADLKPGVYRGTQVWEDLGGARGYWRVEVDATLYVVGGKLDVLEAEGQRLVTLGRAAYRQARTGKPGVEGYQHMEDMARQAQEATKQESRYLGEHINTLVASLAAASALGAALQRLGAPFAVAPERVSDAVLEALAAPDPHVLARRSWAYRAAGAPVTQAEARLVHDLVSGYVEDIVVAELEDEEGDKLVAARAMLDRLDAALAAFAD